MKSLLRIPTLLIPMLFVTALGWAQQTDQPSNDSTKTETKPTKAAKFDTHNPATESDIVKRLDTSANVLDEIMGTPDKGIPTKILGDAKCIIVIPSMVNIAVGGSWGLQLGGQAIDLVMLVMNQKGMDHLLSSKFKIGAEATGAAGPVGRQAAADTDWKMKAEILTYSRARGLFAGIDLNGAAIRQDKDETAVLYGKMLPFQTILSGNASAPSGSKAFLAAVHKYSQVAAEKKEGE
jgi:SH3 domain-containing YSC84-like protein 1